MLNNAEPSRGHRACQVGPLPEAAPKVISALSQALSTHGAQSRTDRSKKSPKESKAESAKLQ